MTITPGTTDQARETAGSVRAEGAALAHSGVDAGSDLAQATSEQASQVASEAAAQAKDLLATAKEEVGGQVDAQRRRLVEVLRTTGNELGSTGDQQSALTAELTRHASTQARRFADYLDQHGPDAVLTDVRSFARRRPGTFLLLAGVGGLVAGRVFRSVSAGSTGSTGSGSAAGLAGTRAGLAGTQSVRPVVADQTNGMSTYAGLGVGSVESVATDPYPTVREAYRPGSYELGHEGLGHEGLGHEGLGHEGLGGLDEQRKDPR